MTGVDAPAVDAVIGAWLAEQARGAAAVPTDPLDPTSPAQDAAQTLLAVAVDGKTVRGAVDTDGAQVHLLAAATHGDQLVLGQLEVGVKTNEIPLFAPLLDQLTATGIDLSRLVLTVEALHTQRSHATYLHGHGAGFVFTAKQNQPGLFASCRAPEGWRSRDRPPL